ncbi:Vmc-like lipoprotein signal peptide domain-containing protein [Ureaplasma zalophigenitalium]|uniref:Iron ABC transporter substrate-binding protein n=1 Tax=Ureaplasma zalophigenitalium TaxID=907723 RepID=A0ABT3BPJ2_9BACT|nr:hypothetical protein [Ureaplasma zalophigenitalium]MCV3754156.1 hypothetical protein [Ureaplasma zalophigenitalium]
MLKNKIKRILWSGSLLIITTGLIASVSVACSQNTSIKGPVSGYYLSADKKIATIATANFTPKSRINYYHTNNQFSQILNEQTNHNNHPFITVVENEEKWLNLIDSTNYNLEKIINYNVQEEKVDASASDFAKTFTIDKKKHYDNEAMKTWLKNNMQIDWTKQSVIILDSIHHSWKPNGVIGDETAGLNITNYTLQDNKLTINFQFKPQLTKNNSKVLPAVFWSTNKTFFLIVDQKNINVDKLLVEYVVAQVKSLVKQVKKTVNK